MDQLHYGNRTDIDDNDYYPVKLSHFLEGHWQTCHLVRIVRIQYGFWPFLRWYGRITLWYGFAANYWKIIYEYVYRNKTVLSSDTTSFFR